MADVSTWEDFVDKYTDNSTSTINITSDLTVPPTGITSEIGAGTTKTINGNDHFIYNIAGTASTFLSTYSGGVVPNHTVSWGNVQFQNIYGQNSRVFAINNSSFPMNFTNCIFQGQGQKLFDGKANLNSCALTWSFQGKFNLFDNSDFRYCWIWLKDCIVTDEADEIMFYNLYNCYLKGTLTGGTGITTLAKLSTNTENSVINFSTDLTLTKVASSTTATTVINSTKIPNYTATETNVVKVTDAEMKNAAALADAGFPIIVLP